MPPQTTETSSRALVRAGFRTTLWITAICTAIACVQADGPKPVEPPATAEQFVAGEIIIQFQPGTTADRIETILAATGTRIKRGLGAQTIYLIAVDSGVSVEATIRRLVSFPEVRSAEPNQVIRLNPP